jgi:hypothetical protein
MYNEAVLVNIYKNLLRGCIGMKKKLQGVIIGMVIMGLFYSYPVLAAFVDKKITVQTGVNICQ